MDTGFIVVYVGRAYGGSDTHTHRLHQIPRYNIGERLIVTKVRVSTNTGITYYEVTDGRTSGGWYDAKLFKRLDEIREERLKELGI